MATDNKKVSGYLPQSIFDLFEDFREKRSLSASSALIAILSEYFKVDHKVEQSSLPYNNDFVSREQFESLEIRLSELSSSLLSEVDRLFEQRFSGFRSELLSSSLESIEVQTVNIASEPFSESLNEPPRDDLPNEPKSSPPQLELGIVDPVVQEKDSKVSSDFTLVEASVSFLSLSGQRLAKRLSITTTMLSTKKTQLSDQEFYDWLQAKDPNKISWQPAGGDLKKRVTGWVPSQDTLSEPLSRLKEWLDTNPD